MVSDPQSPGARLRERVEELALDYHKILEGEYGCGWPQTQCPGVKRLIAFANRAIEAADALRASSASEGQLDAIRAALAHAECCDKDECGPPEVYRCIVCRLRAIVGAASSASEGAPAAVRCSVSPICDGEENDGPLQSTDLFVEGRGISLLCNVSAGDSFTYSLIVDGKMESGGTVGVEASPAVSPAPPDNKP